MSRIFLSHSSKDNFEAQALRNWLASEGWDDVFLDLDPNLGIAAGERWERSLHAAAHRCEAVVFLVSANWLASGWCRKEYELARGLNKKLFAALVDSAKTIADLPPELTDVWQAIDLAGGQDQRLFSTTLPGSHQERHIAFSLSGLLRLKRGLERAGLDPKYFLWPPENDPNRAPYRGLKSLEAEDAGVLFGRDAPIIEAVDRLRGLGQGAPPRLFVILGASGTGKSSFLRAGLLPRLARDDSHFIALPPLRAGRSALTGETGFVAALEGLLPGKSRAEIRTCVQSGAATLRALLVERMKPAEGERPASLVIAIDQAEEMFRLDADEETLALLTLIRDLAATDAPPIIAIFAIRSDSYDQLEHCASLQGLPQATQPLLPLPRGAYVQVIEGPIQRLTAAGRKLSIEPRLTERLLADLETGGGSDALPLLAFTLEQLYLDYLQTGMLRLADYEAMGGLRGAIDAAVRRALTRADADPRIPKDREARAALLRRGLIPWLAGIDPESRSPRRNIARLSDIPAESAPLIELLVEERLLSTDTRVERNASGNEVRITTIEPAHEALLRQRGLLNGWLNEDFGLLVTLEALKRAAGEWDANGQNVAWLSHHGARLVEAKALLQRDDIVRRLDSIDLSYLEECASSERMDAARERRGRFQRMALLAGLVVFGVSFALASPRLYAQFLRERAIAEEAMRTDIAGQIAAYAVVDGGLEADQAEGYQTSPYTTPLLRALRDPGQNIIAAISSVNTDVLQRTHGSQRPFLSTSMSGDIYLWRQPSSRRKRAVVLSVDNPGEACNCKLKAPLHDGDGIYALLHDVGFSANESVRLHNADKTNVFDTIESICEGLTLPDKAAQLMPGVHPIGLGQLQPRENTLVFFFFSGHGVSIRAEKYILPFLGDRNEPTEKTIQLYGIRLGDLEHQLSKCAAQSIVIIDTHFPEIVANYF